MIWNPLKKSSWTKLGNDINDKVIQPVVDTGKQAIGVVENTATDLYKDTSKAATDADNYSVS